MKRTIMMNKYNIYSIEIEKKEEGKVKLGFI